MKVFLAGIIQGSLAEATIHKQDWRQPIKQAIARHVPRATIYCHYTRHPKSITYGMPMIRRTFRDGLRRAANCDVLVAYLPSASMGTAIEMHQAKLSGAVVLTITPMAANWVVRIYSDGVFASVEAFEEFLASGKLEGLVRAKTSMMKPRKTQRAKGKH